MKVLKVSDALAFDALEEGALFSVGEGSSHLLRFSSDPVSSIVLQFTPPAILYDLTIGLHAHKNHLLSLNIALYLGIFKEF